MHSVYKISARGCSRYIGITKKSLSKRLSEHLTEARKSKKNVHRLNWLRSLEEPPNIELLESVLPSDCDAREQYWISLFQDYGSNLVNSNGGGGGGISPTEEVREKIRQANLGKKASLETRAKMSASHTGKEIPSCQGRQFSPIHRERLSLSRRGKVFSLTHRASLRAARLGKSHSMETKEKLRARRIGKFHSTETKERMSVAHLARIAKMKASVCPA